MYIRYQMDAVTPTMTVRMVHIATLTYVYHPVRIALHVLMVCAEQLPLVLSQ